MATGLDDDQQTRQLLDGVAREGTHELCMNGGKRLPSEAKDDDAGRWRRVDEGQPTEVQVARHEDAAVAGGRSEHLGVGSSGADHIGGSDDVVTGVL